jgi:uncharacterized protein (TIGR03067 family)
MTAPALIIAFALLGGGSDPPAGGKIAKGLEPLQGTWKLAAFEVDGEPSEFPARLPRWVIKADKVVYGGGVLAQLSVDAGGTPPGVDLAFVKSKRVYEGIFAVEGDTLKICVNQRTEGVKERPLDFTTKDKEGRRLLVFKREKPGADDGTKDAPGFVGIQIGFDKDSDKVVVMAALKGSPAMQAGLKQGDKILMIGATKPDGVKGAVDAVREARPATDLTIRVDRDGKEMDIRIRVAVIPFFLLDLE